MLNIRVVENGSLILGRMGGTLDDTLLQRTVEFLEIKEAELENGFSRYCDLTGLDGVRLGLGAVEAVAARRRAFNPNRIRVKSAFLATEPLTWAVVELYRELLKSPRIQVRSFRSVEDAAQWLDVDPKLLAS
jgi:hypothetical protein